MKSPESGNRQNSSDSPPILLGLLGYPLGHSVSPVLHRAAGETFGMDIHYYLFETEEADLRDAVRGLRALGFTGCNVTIPYKEKILDYVDEKSEVVEFLGAANTLSFRGRSILAHNTDWQGFLQDWNEKEMGEIEGKNAVILGAGGSASAIVYALAQSGVGEVQVFNRHKERGEELIEKFSRKFPGFNGKAYSIESMTKLPQALKSAHILINTTPVGMFPDMGRMPIHIPKSINPELRYYDLIYNPIKTKMAEELEKLGIKSVCGSGMLVHQAAFAFRRWLGLEPDTGAMYRAAFGS